MNNMRRMEQKEYLCGCIVAIKNLSGHARGRDTHARGRDT